MAAFVKYYSFVYDLCDGSHDLNDTSTLRVMLLTASYTPNVATDAVKGDIDTNEISYTNLTPSSAADVANARTDATGTVTIAGTDITFNCSGGASESFRYAVLYNDTPTSPADPLIGYWDYGSTVQLANGESFTVDFGASIFTVT